jgi:outer membrane protein OmpA-like peptidoglycan-associated protein
MRWRCISQEFNSMLKRVHIVLLGVLLLLGFSTGELFGQKIQWASGVESQTNAYGTNEWSAQQILGAPNAFPLGELNPNAFRMKSDKGNSKIVLTFDNPQTVRQVLILESYLPGRLQRVLLYDDKKNRFAVFEEAYQTEESFRFLTIPLSKALDNIVKVELYMDASKNQGWAQIDAVGISEEANPSLFVQILKENGQWDNYEAIASKVVKKNLGPQINSSYDEVKPIVSPDGSTLYFSRRNFPGNSGGSQDLQDIYFAEMNTDGVWGEAQNIGRPLNNRNPNGITAVIGDGNQVLLINEYKADGSYQIGLSISQKVQGQWQFPKKVEIEGFVNLNDYVDFTISPNGNVMIMAIETKESLGDQDLYVSFYKGNNQWTRPKNIGKPLNTAKAEFSPYLAPDGKTLYFASEGHGGYGQSDIFYTKRLDDSWLNWSPPVNLGPNVNTPGFDGYFTIPANSDWAYVVSMDGSRAGSRDIYQVKIPPELVPERIFTLKGIITDAVTKKPLEAEIALMASNTETAKLGALRSDPQGGNYSAIIAIDASYEIHVRAEGYKINSQILGNLIPDQNGEVIRNFELEPLNSLVNPLVTAQASAAQLPSPALIETIVKVQEERELPQLMSFSVILKDKFSDLVIDHGIANTTLFIPEGSPELLDNQSSDAKLYEYSLFPSDGYIDVKASAKGYFPAQAEFMKEEWQASAEPLVVYLTPESNSVNAQGLITSASVAKLRAPESISKVAIPKPSELPPLFSVIGKVLEDGTHQPLGANVVLRGLSSNQIQRLTSDARDGLLIWDDPQKENLIYEASLSGYFIAKGQVEVVKNAENGLVEFVIYMKPIQLGISLAIPNMLFVQSKSEMLPISHDVLDSLADVLREHPTVEILLAGHTDAIGDPKLNLKLSEDRVDVVKQYLVDAGIDSKRIKVEAWGGKKPLATNAREETRRLNRRVEVTFLKY